MSNSRRCRRPAQLFCAVALVTAPLVISPVSALARGVVPAVSTQAATPFNISIDGAGTFATSLPPSSVATYVLPSGGRTVQEWLTAGTNGAQLAEALTEQPAISLGAGNPGVTLAVHPGDPQQKMTGFGAALTDSAAYDIDAAGTTTAHAIIQDLFGPSGANLTMVRVPMGATDLIRPPYENWSYDDPTMTSTDPGLTQFSVGRDLTDGVIPLLQAAQKLQPGLQLIAAPWSAPAWMKVNDSMTGGDCATNTLNALYYSTYASYFVKFVQAYQNNYQLPVDMVSMQNEPENCNWDYPTMSMTEPEEARFAGDLRAAFTQARLTTKILGFDHNWYNSLGVDGYPNQLLTDAGANVDAIGYHCYASGGNPDAYEQQVSWRRTLVLMTECTGTMSYPATAVNLVSEVRNDLLGPIRNSASGSLYWSLALSGSGQPAQPLGGCQDCRGLITVGAPGKAFCQAQPVSGYCLSEDYFYWAQFSKFVDRNATVIGSDDLGLGGIETVAFRNPDGSIVVVALNSTPVTGPPAPGPPAPGPPAPGPPVTSYYGHIVQWDGDTSEPKTSWLVGPDGHRRWINGATASCLKASGAPGPDVLTSSELDQLPDLTNVWAVCGTDQIGINGMLQQGFYARSPNGAYTLRLTGSNLTLTDAAGNVRWQTGSGGDELILRSDGNLVEYAAGTAVWSSDTAGSGAAWLDVSNDGTLEVDNSAGSPVWTSADPSSYRGHIVEWANGGGQPNTAWLVAGNGERYWIPGATIYSCLVDGGHSDLGPQSSAILNVLPDSGQWAHCP